MLKLRSYIIISIIISSVIIARNSQPGDIYNDALLAFNQHEYSKAQKLFEVILSDPNIEADLKSTAFYYKGECHFSLSEYNAAASTFEGFISKFPFSSLKDRALYRLGIIYVNDREYDKARTRLNELVQNYFGSEFLGSAYYLIGESYSAQKRYDEASENFRLALNYSSTNSFQANTIYSLGNAYEHLGDYDKAVEQYDEILSFYRDSELESLAQLRIGATYYNLKKYDNAVIELSDPKIKRLNSQKETEALMLLANSFFKLKEYKNAQDIFNELIEKNPELSNEEQIKFSLAKINFQSGNYDEAYDAFIELITSDVDSVVANSVYWAAESKRYSGQTNQAAELYERFLENFPNQKLAEQVAFNLASIYYQEKREVDAEKILLNLRSSPNSNIRIRSFNLLGEINFNRRKYQESNEYYRSAVNIGEGLNNEHHQALLGKGVSDYYLDDFNESIKSLGRLIETAPNFERSKANFYLAEANFAAGEFQRSITYYNRVNTDDSQVGLQTIFGKAYAYYNSKDYANAIFYFNEYISKSRDPNKIVEANLRLADSFYGTKNFVRSSQIYDEVFSKYKNALNNDYALYQYGQALFYAERPSDAISKFRELQQKFPKSRYTDESQYLIGWIQFRESNFKSAVNEYKIMLDKYPNSPIVPIALYSIGDSYFNLAEYDSSIAYYNTMIDRFRNSEYVLDAINGIQYSFIAKDQPEYAVEYLQRFVLLNPKSKISDQVKFKQADVHYSLGEYEKARQVYTEFINQFPSSSLIPNGYYWIGKCSELLKQDLDAITNFKLVIDRYLKSEVGVDAVIELGQAYQRLKMNKEALLMYDSALDKIGNNSRIPEILFEKADLLLEEDNVADAYETLDYIINYYDGTLFADKAKVELGVLELKRGGYQNAELLFSELGAKRTDDIGAKAQYHYGLTLLEQEKLNQAISAFVRVRSVFGTYDEWLTKSLLKLGDIYVKLNDKNNARDMYRAVLQKHSNDEWGREARNKLNSL
ncbi:MAG: tetratricopeptide repeat protein [Melioribacteraceae bacterium]|nr:tetratricopeptide repeat protein [Melioribacteraceae bacterium]